MKRREKEERIKGRKNLTFWKKEEMEEKEEMEAGVGRGGRRIKEREEEKRELKGN